MGPGRALPGVAGLKFAGKLATRPHKLVRRGAGLAAELGKVAVGRSELEPEKGDRRFKDKAWQNNPAFRRVLQAYLAAGQTVDDVISDTDLDWKSDRRVRFSAENALDALAPSNSPFLNPTVLKATIDSGGLHFLKGLRNLAGDIRPALPAQLGRQVGVRGRRGPGQHARRGGAQDRAVRADPVPPADRQGARGAPPLRPADDQQVLRRRPRREQEPARVGGQAGPAGVHHLLAQPELRARRLEPRHLPRGRGRVAGRGRGHHRRRSHPGARACARAGPCRPSWPPGWPSGARATGSPAWRWASTCSTPRSRATPRR